MTTFTKVGDAWGVKIEVNGQPSGKVAGDSVQVQKKSGETKMVTLDKLVGTQENKYGKQELWTIVSDRKPKREGAKIEEPGVFETGEGVFVVRRTQDKERLYALKVIELRDSQGDRLTEDGRVRYDLQFVRGQMARLVEEDRMPIERIKDLRFSHCVVCGAKLEVAESIERGVGPVCAKQFRGGV
jgi:hypothetical protein